MIYDVVVIGAGAAGMTAASVAAAGGLRVLLVEKAAQVGGTTAISGGMVWAPANAKMAAAGLDDSIERAETYLRATVGAFDAPRQQAFLRRVNEAVVYLERHTSVQLRPVTTYPDYRPNAPGATGGGRVLESVPFDGRALGADLRLLAPPLPEFTLFGGMMIERADIPHFRKALRRPRSFLRVTRLLARYALERLSARRGLTLILGNALAGRLLHSLRRLGVDLALETQVSALQVENGRVCGASLVDRGGVRREVQARHGVIVATGGFGHDPALRRRLLSPGAAADDFSATAAASTGDGLRLGLAVGGEIAEGRNGNAFGAPVSRFRRADGLAALFPHTVTDRSKPGLIAVTKSGRRFTNEAVSYHDFVGAMLSIGEIGPGAPAFLICDRRFIRIYGLGAVKPFAPSLRRHVRDGSLIEAATLQELATRCGIDADAFAATLARYNEGARAGRDDEFGRGGDIYQRHLGDADHAPNPCVAAIERPPFYAVAVHPGDLGTAAGLATDEFARVLDQKGEPIQGLYACGNDMASVMEGAYPGPGITLGPALTFGYIAAKHIAESVGGR